MTASWEVRHSWAHRNGAGRESQAAVLDGEHAENLIRKDFTVSERVAIGKSMAARLGERRGGDRVRNFKPEKFPG